MALSGCGVSLLLVWRKGFPRFLIEGFPFFAFLTLSALPHTKKISRSARNDGARRGYPGLHVLSIKKGSEAPPFFLYLKDLILMSDFLFIAFLLVALFEFTHDVVEIDARVFPHHKQMIEKVT